MTAREGKAEPLQAVAADYVGGIREGSVTPVVIYDQNENVLGASQPLKYVALVSQTGTSNPVVTVIFNNTGRTISWARTDVGKYVGTASSALFTNNKTILYGLNTINGAGLVSWEYDTTTEINLYSTDFTGTNADATLAGATVVIEVYP